MATRRSRLTRLISTQRGPRTSGSSQAAIIGLVRGFFPIWYANRERMMIIDAWARCDLTEDMKPSMPDNATDEFKRIRERSSTPFGLVVVDSFSQEMIIDDVKMATGDSAPAYELWQRNGLDARQIPVHEGMLTFGQSYEIVLPAVGRLDRKPTAVIRGKSAMRSLAFYRDDFDEYPDYFLEAEPEVRPDGTAFWWIWFTDEFATHRLTCESNGAEVDNLTYIDHVPHGMDMCPVVRHANRIDLDGRVVGEIAPIVNVLGRIDQDTQDRLVKQRFGAWAVRTIAGMKEPATDAQKQAARIALGVGDFLVSENPETKFSTLPGSPMDGDLRARESDVRDLSATSQVPNYHFLGLSDNVGADGLAAARGSLIRKRNLRRVTSGEAHETSLRLAGYAMGDDAIANDFESRVHWRQDEIQSFQSLAQGLADLVQRVGLPAEMAVEMLPDWTQLDTVRFKRLVDELRARSQADMEIAADIQAEAARANAPAAS